MLCFLKQFSQHRGSLQPFKTVAANALYSQALLVAQRAIHTGHAGPANSDLTVGIHLHSNTPIPTNPLPLRRNIAGMAALYCQ